jgi:hypothetical protein
MSLTFRFIDPRYWNRVIYKPTGIIRPPLAIGENVVPSHDFGTGTLPASVGRNWTVMLSMKNTSVGAGWVTQHEISVLNMQCPPGGCPPPPVVRLGNSSLWSDPLTWAPLPVPRAGDDVVINATMYVVLDVATPTLGTVTVYGRLEFLDRGAASPELVSLSAGQVVVWGQLAIGSPTEPYLGRAEIALNGDRYSGGAVIIADAVPPLGNKNIVVIGSFVAVGATVPIPWTRLASTAAAGATNITLTEPAGSAWPVGATVVLTPTNYDISQREEKTISAVSADGLTVSFTTPLLYSHFSGVVSQTSHSGDPVELRAAAGLLTRNVVIRGNLSGVADT